MTLAEMVLSAIIGWCAEMHVRAYEEHRAMWYPYGATATDKAARAVMEWAEKQGSRVRSLALCAWHIDRQRRARKAATLRVYHGRVEGVTETGEVLATLWQQPRGEEWIATITPEQLDGQPAHPGARLVVETWKPVLFESGIRVEVHNRVLTDEERQEAIALAAALVETPTGHM